MQRKLIRFLSFVHGSCLILLLLMLPVTLIYPDSRIYWLRALTALLPLAVSSYAVRHIRRLSVYLLLGILCCAALFFWSSTIWEKLYLTAVSAIVFLVRIPARLKNEEDLLQTPGPYCLILFAIVYIVGLLIPYQPFCYISYRLAFCYLLMLILHTNLSHISDYLEQNRDIANLPGKQIASTNRVMLLIFILFSLLVMLVLPASGLTRLGPWLANAALGLLRFLFSLLPGAEESQVIEETAQEAIQQENMMDYLPQNNTPAWLTALLNLIAVAFAAAVILVLAAAAICGLIELFRHFYRPVRENNDTQEFISEEKADISAFSVRRKKEPSLTLQFHPNAVIRRIYKKRIRKGVQARPGAGKSEPIPESFTPTELEQYAGIPAEEAVLLHSLYEKARYADGECSREDVNLLKVKK